ncbi:selenoprotein S isoform X2 [Cyprinodon tularosa]|uniref:selenoprotein S isoform X2 n=1 Tax=Cyprinodon tularosa TaxID=77115 RepID=UPI0018E25B53|nr:selenoprotein S isoform X2 [Cyprinodon tularosa]
MDDDVVIEDVDDANVPQRIPLKNQDLGQLGFTAEFLSLYGWYLLAAAFTLILLIQQLKKRRSAQQEAVPHTLLDASLVTKRQEAMEAARQRMQEELDAKAAIFKEKQRQLEEEKRRQKIEDWESMTQGRSSKGHKLSEGSEEAGSSTAVPKPKRSNDYNPLMGQGGSCTFRPGRRGPSAGG